MRYNEMMELQSLFILGRQQAIGRAELESVLGSEHVAPGSAQSAVSDVHVSEVPFTRLGGSVKLAQVLGVLHGTNLRESQRELAAFALECAQTITEGKIQLGVSAYDVKASPKQLLALGLELKKNLRARGYSVRLVPNQDQEPALSSAQVLHNHLVGERGIELILARSGDQIVLGRTVAVQDITGYARRDQGRPKRDAFVGMLPPKLAQIIVNLGAGPGAPSPTRIALDPFCGTGVVLQEALLMGFGAYGSDLEPRMIDFSRTNLAWLSEQHGTHAEPPLEVGDATTHQWREPFDFVVCESYLGQPLNTWPKPEKLQQIIATCNLIIDKFLRNLHAQMAPGSRLCVAVPAWIEPSGRIHHLPLLDRLEKMGYNRISFATVVSDAELVYYRPGQIVARELLIITRK